MTRILNETCTREALFSQEKGKYDTFPFHIPAGEVFHSGRLTILDTLLGGEALISAEPPSGQAAKGEVQVEWSCDSRAMVKYQIEVFSCPAPGSASAGVSPVTRQLAGFLPSVNGFPFKNQFKAVPPIKLIGKLR
jgi:hypothetical protein